MIILENRDKPKEETSKTGSERMCFLNTQHNILYANLIITQYTNVQYNNNIIITCNIIICNLIIRYIYKWGIRYGLTGSMVNEINSIQVQKCRCSVSGSLKNVQSNICKCDTVNQLELPYGRLI